MRGFSQCLTSHHLTGDTVGLEYLDAEESQEEERRRLLPHCEDTR